MSVIVIANVANDQFPHWYKQDDLELWSRRKNHGEIEIAGHIKASIISCAFTWRASCTSDRSACVFHTIPSPPQEINQANPRLSDFNPAIYKITNYRQETPRHMSSDPISRTGSAKLFHPTPWPWYTVETVRTLTRSTRSRTSCRNSREATCSAGRPAVSRLQVVTMGKKLTAAASHENFSRTLNGYDFCTI